MSKIESLAAADLLRLAGKRRFGTILADPPWQFTNKTGKVAPEHKRLARYSTMKLDEIMALPVAQVAAPTSHLYLWCPNALLPEGLATMKAWGFTYKTGGSWTKTTRTGKRAFGTGYIFRTATEPFLIGTIGEPRYRSKSIRNLIESERREHSRKPPEAREMIGKLLPDVFCAELFARQPWAGNDVWGNDTNRFAEAS